MLSLDTETTGVDFKHGAKPFYVTLCDELGQITYFEWDVDPFTREPTIPLEDVSFIRQQLQIVSNWGNGFDDEIKERHCIILQNPKFDVAALQTIDIEDWPWEQTRDTLMAGHLLASNLPHDLTSMALQYLGKDIQPLEDKLEKIVQKARRICRSKAFKQDYGEWAIARDDRADMPSCPKSKQNRAGRGDDRDSAWKFDMWLPRMLRKRVGGDKLSRLAKEDTAGWDTALSDYSNADSGVTLALWFRQKKLIEERGLWGIYRERLRVLPAAASMEDRGLSISKSRLYELRGRYREESEDSKEVCEGIATECGYTYKDKPLSLSGGTTHALRDFMLNRLNLEPVYNPKAKTAEPTLNKEALGHYLVTVNPRSREHCFVRNLTEKRSRDTACSFMDSYEKFWLNQDEDFKLLFPRLNPTGTDTLRWSHSNPNEANISKKEGFNLRYCFGPAKGREWWSLDAKGIEDRIPAFESKQQELIDIFEHADDPPYYGSNHLLRFHTVYPDIWEKELKEVGIEKVGPHCKKKYAATWYQWCKNGGFAVQYGAVLKASGWGTADKAFHRQGAHDLLKTRFANLEELNQEQIRFANKHGYVETLPDRSVDPDRGYPIMCTRTHRGRILETVPLNYHVQGTAMWWTMKAMIRVAAFFARLNRGELFERKIWAGGYYIVMQVHDELVVDSPTGNPREYNLPVMSEVRRLMTLGGDDIGIPTPVGLEFHPVHWAEGITIPDQSLAV